MNILYDDLLIISNILIHFKLTAEYTVAKVAIQAHSSKFLGTVVKVLRGIFL